MTKQYDICSNANSASRKLVPYLIVLQADLMRDFQTVIVAPLRRESMATTIAKLNPVVKIEGKTFRVSMAELAGVLRSQLGNVVANVEDQHREFVDAIDLLFTGI